MTVLFQTQNVRVNAVGPFKSKQCVITFSERDERGLQLDRPGFAQDFCRKNSLDGIYITCRENEWYQYGEMASVCRIISEFCAHQESITFGSSMGAFAALNFARALNAKTCIAISPQFSIDPAKVPWEKRWWVDSSRIRFLNDAVEVSLQSSTIPYVIYDPFHQDAKHVAMIRACTDRVRLVRVPFGGHPAGHFLRETGLLSSVIGEMVTGVFDIDAWPRRRRARRGSSETYVKNLGEILKRRRGP